MEALAAFADEVGEEKGGSKDWQPARGNA